MKNEYTAKVSALEQVIIVLQEHIDELKLEELEGTLEEELERGGRSKRVTG